MASASAASAPVKRACDGCHRRKVKCVSGDASKCQSCASAGVACTYNAIPQKKGPKGTKGKVLTKLLIEQRNALRDSSCLQEPNDNISLPRNVRMAGLLSPVLLEQCVDFFFGSIYPLQPVLEWRHMQEAIANMDNSAEAYSMVLAFCTYTMLQTDTEVSFSPFERSETVRMGCVFLEEACRLRSGCSYQRSSTYQTILTSWFCHGCYLELGESNAAWCHLREATTQTLLLGMHNEETYRLDPHDAPQKRALYWLLFIAERTHSIQQHRPITLHPTINKPSPSGTYSHETQLACMIGLYKSIDSPFIDLWNGVRRQADVSWVHELQMSLLEVVPSFVGCTRGQTDRILITQHWLRMVIWQLCSFRGLLSSLTKESMLLLSPIHIAKDLQSVMGKFSQSTVHARGNSLARKVFDIACCLVDAVARPSSQLQADASGSKECIPCLLTFAQFLGDGESRYTYLPLLHAKIQELLPEVLAAWPFNVFHWRTTPPINFHTSGGDILPQSEDIYGEAQGYSACDLTV